MSVIRINGGKRLDGTIKIQGAKNSALPILAATLLCRGSCMIHNCPELSDVDTALKILIELGCTCVRDEDTVIVDSSKAVNYRIPDILMREMRSSVVFLGAILSRMGKAVISRPGGCELGPRPIDLHILALKKLGAIIEENGEFVKCKVPGAISGTEIFLPFPSVGATENVILAAAVSKGTTIINNAAREPEIGDLAEFLNGAGANIKGAGTSTVIIKGVTALHGTEHTVIPDRIAAATYMSAVAGTGGECTLENVNPVHMLSVLDFFRETGCQVYTTENTVFVDAVGRFNGVKEVITGVYPAFPTDAGPVIFPYLSMLDSPTVFTETIFENRYRFIDELKRFGAKITVKDRVAVIHPVHRLRGASARCTDLRGGAALIVAGLISDGLSEIHNIYHISRGYGNIVCDLKKCGADIQEIL